MKPVLCKLRTGNCRIKAGNLSHKGGTATRLQQNKNMTGKDL